MNAPRQVPQAVIEALMRGDKMTAIRLIRESSGGDLKSAMQMVQQIAVQLQGGNAGHTGQTGPIQSGPTNTVSSSAEETKGMRENRRRTEEFLHHQRPPTVMPGDGGQKQVAWVIVIIVAAVAWWLLSAAH